MKKYTKKLTIFLALSLLVGACGGSEPEKTTTPIPTTDEAKSRLGDY